MLRPGRWSRFAAILALIAAGCNVVGPDGFEPPSRPAPGVSFATAGPVLFDRDGLAVLAGRLASGQGHVFNLGPCATGDRIGVSLAADTEELLIRSFALFDSDQLLLAVRRSPVLELSHVIREATDHCYLAVAGFTGNEDGGQYTGRVRIQPGVDRTANRFVQAVVLNFEGGLVRLANGADLELPVFGARDVGPSYEGMTERMRSGIIETVQENFRGTGLLIITRADPELTWSTLHFGGFDPASFGRAENLDLQNMNTGDDGIVFTDRFAEAFRPRPSADEIAVAIGNVASHEIGHLVGLFHVDDAAAIMDASGPVTALLGNQAFKIAPLNQAVFPIGRQDAAAVIREAVCPFGLECTVTQ